MATEITEFMLARLRGMIANYEAQYGRKPQVIALGKTHLADLNITDSFDGISVMQHDDPIGILMAHDNRTNKEKGNG